MPKLDKGRDALSATGRRFLLNAADIGKDTVAFQSKKIQNKQPTSAQRVIKSCKDMIDGFLGGIGAKGAGKIADDCADVCMDAAEISAKKARDVISKSELESFLKGTRVRFSKETSFGKEVDVDGTLDDFLRARKIKTDYISYNGYTFLKGLNRETIAQFSPMNLLNILGREDLPPQNVDFLNSLAKLDIDDIAKRRMFACFNYITNPNISKEGSLEFIETLQNISVNSDGEAVNMLQELTKRPSALLAIFGSNNTDFDEATKLINYIKSTTINVCGEEKSLVDVLGAKGIYGSIKGNEAQVGSTSKLIETLKKRGGIGKDFDTENLPFMFRGMESSKLDGEEYLRLFEYFSSLADNEGRTLLSDVPGRISRSEIINYFINIDPGSVEASNFEMLLELVRQGKAGRHVFQYLPLRGKMNPQVAKDIDTLYNAYVKGIDPKDAFIPDLTGASEKIAKLKTGEVFVANGSPVQIKLDDGSSETLNLSKDTFYKLFPPIERYGTTQNGIGNCWEITGLNEALSDDKARVNVLRCLFEDGDDIVVRFPGGKHGGIRFKGGNLPEGACEDFYSNGAKGIQILEHADGLELYSDRIQEAFDKLKENATNSKNPFTKMKYKKQSNELTKFLQAHGDKTQVNVGDTDVYWGEYSGKYMDPTVASRNGGQSQNVWKRIGLKDVKSYKNCDKAIKKLRNIKDFDGIIAEWSSKHGMGIETPIEKQRGIIARHAYRLKPGQTAPDGTILTYKLINPWSIAEVELTPHELEKYGEGIQIAKTK